MGRRLRLYQIMDYYSYPVEVEYLNTGLTSRTQAWLEINVGPWGTKWIRKGGVTSPRTTHIYYFKEEKDAIMFALKWK